MTSPKRDLLLGKIALRAGMITREQLYDCLIVQDRNPSRTLGSILISRGHLKKQDVDRLLEMQKKAFAESADGTPSRRHALFGRLLVEKGLATEYQVNECLRLQGRLNELGIKPVPPLGEILVQREYLNREAVETALDLQSLHLYACPECGHQIDTPGEEMSRGTYTCPECRADIPALFAKMAAAVKEALDGASKELDIDLPDEVRLAGLEQKNQFGKYILIREIGRGGSGIVYRAWQKDFNRMVALKLLPHESDTASGVKTPFGDVEDLKRFYNETRAAADLDHPNIAPILDFGNINNHFFYTMKLLDGATLDDIVREGVDTGSFDKKFLSEVGKQTRRSGGETGRRGDTLPLRTTVQVMRDLALAVDYAHQKGIYHRDLKPGNIILDRNGHPWILDLGLAKVKRIGDPAYVKGVVMGTPYYMPPEQALGDMEKVDHLSDIYSLGAVFYELISGTCPYAGQSPDEVLTALPNTGPQPLESLMAGLHEDVARIVGKAMHRDKKRRYSSARSMANDLLRFQEGRPLAEEPAGARPRPFWRKVRAWFGDD
jgi:serine/threonine protein kinase